MRWSTWLAEWIKSYRFFRHSWVGRAVAASPRRSLVRIVTLTVFVQLENFTSYMKPILHVSEAPEKKCQLDYSAKHLKSKVSVSFGGQSYINRKNNCTDTLMLTDIKNSRIQLWKCSITPITLFKCHWNIYIKDFEE